MDDIDVTHPYYELRQLSGNTDATINFVCGQQLTWLAEVTLLAVDALR